MDRIAQFIVEHSKRVLAVTGVITLVSVAMLFRMSFNADVSKFITEGNATGEAWVALQEKYETGDPVNVLVSAPEGRSLLEKDLLVAVVELRDRLAAIEGVGQVGSIVPEVNPLTGGPLTADQIALVPEGVIAGLLDQNPLADLLVSEDGRNTLMLVVPLGDSLAVAQAVNDVTAPDGLELTLSGNPVIFASMLDKMSWFLIVIPPVIVILLLGVFFANVGDRRLTIFAVFPALLGSVWTFGFIFSLGREVDIVTILVPIFVIVMGSADGLHFVTHYQEQVDRTSDEVDRVTSTLRQVGVPMILTTISTAAGFLSLIFAGVAPIAQLGSFTAAGIVFAGIISFFSLPALLSRIHVEPKHRTALLGPRLTSAVKELAKRRWVAAVLAGVLIAFSGVFIPQLQVDGDQLIYFKKDDPVRLGFEKTAELFGGATPLIGEYAYDRADGLAGLAPVAELSREFEQLPGIRTIFSLADLQGVVPDDQLLGALSGETPLPLGQMASEDGLRFMLLPGAFETVDLQGWLDYADDKKEIRILTGMPVIWDEVARLVLRAQFISLAVAYGLVTLMLALAYRKWRQTVVSLVPLLLTSAMLLGFIAASGIQLNLVTAVISSIVIGVGIDYAIHFVAAIDFARGEGNGYVLRAVDRAGRPIIANALGIAVALTALWLSPFRIHPHISMIMWVSMTTAALTALVIIPALLPREGVMEA
ncbi:MAG: MMPL family transporter [Acidimicrobiia bacterium]|nr:MMPL family transporter [Acidimicrobiia bacterium]